MRKPSVYSLQRLGEEEFPISRSGIFRDNVRVFLRDFAEVEEYFDGDPGLMQAIGPRSQQRHVTNRMGDFNAIVDYPPAPKLSPPASPTTAPAAANTVHW